MKYFVVKEQAELQVKIAEYILKECIFGVSSKCKTKNSRAEAFAVLKASMYDNGDVLEQVCDFITTFQRKGQWRSRRLDDWTITLTDKQKSSTGYVGLKNLGCICYMNSLIQNLFMIPRFRQVMTSIEDPLFIEETREDNVLYQFRKMLLNLQNSEKKYYNPRDFCHAFKDYEGNPTNVTEQMDIDEFSNLLMDRLEYQLKSTSEPTLIKDMFGGVYSN